VIPPLEQIVEETGLSSDYMNEFTWALILARTPRRIEFLQRARDRQKRNNGHLLYLYEERFPADKFSQVVTEENRPRIEQIDALARAVNEAIDSETLTLDVFVSAARNVTLIIFGSIPSEYEKIFAQIEQKL